MLNYQRVYLPTFAIFSVGTFGHIPDMVHLGYCGGKKMKQGAKKGVNPTSQCHK